MSRRSTFSSGFPPPLGYFGITLILGLFGLSVAADDLRFESLRPGSEEGTWIAVVTAKGVAKNRDQLTFWVDGKPASAEAEVLVDDRVETRFTGVAPEAGYFAVGIAGKNKDQPQASVRVGPLRVDEAPFNDWIIYHIMMGYFRNGNPGNDGEIDGWRHPNYAGGDLQGVLEKGKYLVDLGVNAVWLSPIFAAQTSHGYDVTNYYRIGDAVGVGDDAAASLDLFRRLVKDFHERGLRVVLDLPINHASRAYDRSEAGDPGGLRPRSTAARQEAEKVWESWGAAFRYWNFEHEPTRRFLKDVALYWLTEQGVDGLRLDYVRGVEHAFWAELYAEVREKKPGTLLAGECWADAEGAEGNAREIARYYAEVEGVGPQFDSLFDFPMQIALTNVFARGGSALELEKTLQFTRAIYGDGAHPAYFLDNHDMARFLAWTDDEDRLVAAVAFMASLSSPVVVFYGTETGLSHGVPRPGFIDAGRVPMPWESLNQPLIERIAKIFRERKEHPVLSRGGRLPLLAENDLMVMAKLGAREIALVGVNLSAEARDVELAGSGVFWGAGAFETIFGSTVPTAAEGGGLVWRLSPVSTSVVVQPRSR